MRPIFFLHIPKTAGSSVHQFLGELMGGFHFLQHGAEKSTPLTTVFARFPSAGGHLRLADVIADWDPFVIGFTVLRDPVERFLSHYSFLRDPKQSESDPFVRLARANTIEQLVESQDPLVEYLANQQCWYLSALPAFAPLSAHCESAIGNLGCFKVIGWTEDLSSSLARLSRLAGASPHPTLRHLNKTPNRFGLDSLPRSIARRLGELTRFDRQLCAAARNPEQISPMANPVRPLPFASLGSRPPSVFGTRRALIDHAFVAHGQSIITGRRFLLVVQWHAEHDVGLIVVGVVVRNFVGQLAYGTNSENLGETLLARPGQTQRTVINLQANLEPGIYHVDVALHAADCGLREIFHWWEHATSFEVHPNPRHLHEGFADAQAYIEPWAGDKPLLQGSFGDFRMWIIDPPSSLKAGMEFQLDLELFNGTNTPIATNGTNPFHLGYHWRSETTGEISDFEGVRTPLSPAQLAGTLQTWKLRVVAPITPGIYRLLPRLVQENVRWIEPPEIGIDQEPVFNIEL